MFIIVDRTDLDASCFEQRTKHTIERYDRERLLTYICPDDRVYASFIIDKGHVNGLEVHTITKNGIIYIGNLKTKKLITWLIARPGQIKRYGINNDRMIEIAYNHLLDGCNQDILDRDGEMFEN